MSATKEEVKSFLNRLRAKAEIYRIIYEDNRLKNAQTLGHANNSVICISFHIAEFPMHYPFK